MKELEIKEIPQKENPFINENKRQRKKSILKKDLELNNDLKSEKKVEFKEFPQVIPVTSYKKYNAEIDDYIAFNKKKSKCIKCVIF